MLGKLIGLGILTAHFVTYKEYYWKIFRTFSAAFIMKRLVKIAGNKDDSDMVGLGGYSLTFVEVIQLISAVRNNGNKVIENNTRKEILGGLLGEGVDKLMDLFGK